MRQFLLILVFAGIFSTQTNAQIAISSLIVDSFDRASEGDMYIDEYQNLYMGLQDGSLASMVQTANAINVIYAYDSFGGQSLSTTSSKVNIDNVSVNEGSLSLVQNEVVFSETGIYEVSYTVAVEVSFSGFGGAANVKAELVLNATTLGGSQVQDFIPKPAGSSSTVKQSISRTVVVSATSGQSVSIWALVDGGSSAITLADGSGISVVKLN